MDSPASTLATPENVPAARLPLRTFLKKPVLPERATGIGSEGLRGVGRLYFLDLAAMSVLAVIAVTALALGFVFPGNELAGMELTPAWIAIIVLGAPLSEELVFRSWLSGRPGHVLAALLIGTGLFVGSQTSLTQSAAPVNFKAIGLAVVCLGGAAAALFALRGRRPMRWFSVAFPAIFWLVALAFALVHLLNFTEGALWVLLPLVIPQFVVGTLVGYARVQYGLWAAMLLHALHNGTAVALVLLFGEMLPGSMGS